jgi:hypothetical protein
MAHDLDLSTRQGFAAAVTLPTGQVRHELFIGAFSHNPSKSVCECGKPQQEYRVPEPGVKEVHHRRASSSAVAASVLASRYLTMMGVYSWIPIFAATSPEAGLLPGTTTAPGGMVRGSPGRPL